MPLTQNLQFSRNLARLTQKQVAESLQVPRESISMWEIGARSPSQSQLEEIARLYSVSVDFLLDREPAYQDDERLVHGLLNESKITPNICVELSRWLKFLSRWSAISELFSLEQNTGKLAKRLDRGPDFTDARAAPKLAVDARNFFGLGMDALPNIFSFADELGVLVYKANLGDWRDPSKPQVSGAFCNHPKLGFCILVNAELSLSRQYFTLAHELAHALFHYNTRTQICFYKDSSSRENFADTFASHFLVPSRELNRVIDSRKWRQSLNPLKVVELAHIFRVSYAFMLYRLRNERAINEAELLNLSGHSPTFLANQLHIEMGSLHRPGGRVLNLNRFATSILQTVRDLIEHDRLDRVAAADVLDIRAVHIDKLLEEETHSISASEASELRQFKFYI